MSVNTKVNGQLVKSAGLYKASVPIQSGDIYSFEERQIGVWADGKPLYQKSIKLDDVTVPQSSRVLIGLGTYISNIDNIIGGEVIVIDGSINAVLPSFQIATMSQYGLTYTINKADGIVISRGSDSGAVTRDFIATVRYTKTTDVAGSGEYVPSGDKAVHYDDTEQVIGTWFGETLYRKTINFGALPNTTLKNVAHGISNLGYIKSYEGTAYNPTNGYYISLPYLHSSVSNNDVEIYFNETNASIVTKTDRTPYTTCYITLEYTKTS